MYAHFRCGGQGSLGMERCLMDAFQRQPEPASYLPYSDPVEEYQRCPLNDAGGYRVQKGETAYRRIFCFSRQRRVDIRYRQVNGERYRLKLAESPRPPVLSDGHTL